MLAPGHAGRSDARCGSPPQFRAARLPGIVEGSDGWRPRQEAIGRILGSFRPSQAWPGRLVSTPRSRSQVAGGETVEAHPPSRNPPPFPGSSRETCWRGELAGPKARHRRSSGPRLQTTKNHVDQVSIPSLSGLSVRQPASGPRAGWVLRRGLRESPSPPSPPYRRAGAGSGLNRHDGGRVEFPAKWAFVSVFKERPGGILAVRRSKSCRKRP